MNKKVSVVIPCYNVEHYVEECVQSVLDQDYKNIEIICVNDGSTDNTLLNLKKFKEIKLINTKNNGVNMARKKGVELATGDVVMFLDSDDIMIKGSISYMMSKHKKENIVTGFNFKAKYTKFKIFSFIKYSLINTIRRFIPVRHSNPLKHNWYLWAKVFEVDFAKKIKWNKLTMAEDKQIFIDNPVKLKMCWKKVVRYRIRVGSAMDK